MPLDPSGFPPAGLLAPLLGPLLLAALAGCRARDARAGADGAQPGAASSVSAAPLAAPPALPADAAGAAGAAGPAALDAAPRMTNAAPPFRYPPALHARRVQGNVTLRLWVDSLGRPAADSTRVAETSGEAALDSAAVVGARGLTFAPARRGGRPVGQALLFPVFFRHPAAAPLPGDTVLGRPGAGPGAPPSRP